MDVVPAANLLRNFCLSPEDKLLDGCPSGSSNRGQKDNGYVKKKKKLYWNRMLSSSDISNHHCEKRDFDKARATILKTGYCRSVLLSCVTANLCYFKPAKCQFKLVQHCSITCNCLYGTHSFVCARR